MSDSEIAPAIHPLRPPIRSVDVTSPHSIHIVGIGGAGMRALARILLAMGHRVTGSDRARSRFLEELDLLGATTFVGHRADQIQGADFVTRSTAVPDSNVEISAAVGEGLPVYSRAEVLAALTAVRPAVLVAGTHGKTTTSSMLAVVLDHAGLAPSFVIGSDVGYFGSGARWGDNDLFVVEADESDGTFLTLAGAHAVVTSLDPDHLDFYGDASQLHTAFEAFVEAIAGSTAVCIDDNNTHSLLGQTGVVTYGAHPDAHLRLDDVTVGRDTTSFTAAWRGTTLGPVTIALPGHHNALNAAACLAIALELGLTFDAAAEGLARFSGVARRMEVRGEQLGIRFVDDYAHLPAEVEVAIEAARAGAWNRVVATYQPHRFTRTQLLGATFATSFRGVDHLVLTDIYPSGELPVEGVSGMIVYDAVLSACPDLSVSWQPTLDDVADHLAATLGPGDLCLTLGAGDLTTVPDMVIERLARRSRASVEPLVELVPRLRDTTVLLNEPIGPRTTYRVGGAALALVEVGSRAELELVVRAAARSNTPVLPVGRGSNLLVADRGFDGIALTLTGEFEQIDVDGTRVTLGSAVSLPSAARQTVAASLSGFEWAVGVPGSVGGAVAMNAGGHGSDMAATVVAASVMDLTTAEVSHRSLEELRFGYRSSSIAATELVLDATIELAVGSKPEGDELLSEIVRWRREHQPGGQNAGSVFTNPDNDSAGRLIDIAGCKGLRIGTAEVSDKHANFIQVDPGGSADDVFLLMHEVADRVRSETGAELTPETRLVSFAPFGTLSDTATS